MRTNPDQNLDMPNPKPDPAGQSSERQFVENLLNTRVNFLVAVFALACAAAATLDNRFAQVSVLAGSTVIAGMLALATSRAQFKLDLIFEKLESTHPAKETDAAANAKADKLSGIPKAVVGGSRRRLIGYWLPWTTTLFLLIGTVGTIVSWATSSRQTTTSLTASTQRLESRVAALTDSLGMLRSETVAASASTRIVLDSIRAAVRAVIPQRAKKSQP